MRIRAGRRAGQRRRYAAAGALVLAVAGCGSAGRAATGAGVPSYVTEPFSARQKLVAQGARLMVTDGCSVCHLIAARANRAPDFNSFAGHVVTLVDGRRVLVEEAYLQSSLLRPVPAELKGYDPAPMLRALARLHLAGQPQQVKALVAFIEQVGPETEPE
jgi:hypothetical protein